MALDDLIFVGFNGRVLALHRDTGQIVWEWQPNHSWWGVAGFVTQLLDGDRLVISVSGYVYCLDALTGQQLWFNETKGHGTGTATLTSMRGGSSHDLLVMAADRARQMAATGASGG